MHDLPGDPIHGEFHGNASAGAPVVIYKAGSNIAYTLQSWEWIEIESLEIITAAGGDTYLTVDSAANATPSADCTVVRGTLAANSGMLLSQMHFTGQDGNLPYIFSPGATTDCNFRGSVRGRSQPTRQPNWQAHYQNGVGLTGNGQS